MFLYCIDCNTKTWSCAVLCLHRGWTSVDIAQLSVYNLSHSLLLFIFSGHRGLFAVSLSMNRCRVWDVLPGSSGRRSSGRRDHQLSGLHLFLTPGKLLSSGNILEPSNIISAFMPAKQRSEWHKLIWKEITA